MERERKRERERERGSRFPAPGLVVRREHITFLLPAQRGVKWGVE
jgi:hypothetical protein